MQLAAFKRGFNPRTRVGCDQMPLNKCTSFRKFQSTHPRGVRPAAAAAWVVGMIGFNPRTRVGCDKPDVHIAVAALGVSIHAPAWGATPAPVLSGLPYAGFNPRTRVGCDVFPQFMGYGALQFQSTHPRGVRHSAPVKFDGAFQFQSTHPRGVRPRWRTDTPPGAGFNPRTRVGCDVKNPVSDDGTFWFQSTHPRGVRLFPCFIQ